MRRSLHSCRVVNCRLKHQRDAWKKKYLNLKKKLKMNKHKFLKLNDILSVTEKHLSKAGHAFLAAQINLSSKRAKGRRYTCGMKSLALSLFYKGPRAYNFLSNIFTLPSKSSLHLWLQRLSVPAGISCDVLEVLKLRVNDLSPRDRVCSLLIDEVSLKTSLCYDQRLDVVVGFEDMGTGNRNAKLASSSLVFMVRGLALNWKQPLGYFLTQSACKGDILPALLLDCLDKLRNIGLQVVVVISDQGSNFVHMTKTLGVSPDRPYFEHLGCIYHYLFDPPHLLKSIRNNLQKYAFVFDVSKRAEWADIDAFFKLDEQQRFRLAPRLTKKHIELPAFTKMKVKLAAQVISRSVAAGLETHAALKCGQGSDTAEFITVFDDLFDGLNSSQRMCVKKFKCAIADDTEHIAMFEERLNWIKTLKVVAKNGKDVTNIVKCLTGWQLTLSSVISLWSLLKNTYNFDFLLTRRLNQDALENFFSVIRQRGGNCDNPTPLHFSRLFKQVCCNSLLTPVAGSNCEVDSASVLAAIANQDQTPVLENINKNSSDSRQLMSFGSLLMTCNDDSSLEENGLSYVCGYLLRRLLKWHDCDVCKSLWLKSCSDDDSRHIYTTHRLYNNDELKQGSGLISVSHAFFTLVQQCEETFITMFDRFNYVVGILNLIVEELMKLPLPFECTKFPKLLFLRHFVRIRIYYKLKFANSMHSKTKTTANRKVRKLAKLKHE